MSLSRLRLRAEADRMGVSRGRFLRVTTIPWSEVTGFRVERDGDGTATSCTIVGENDTSLLLTFDDTPVAERERFLAFVEAGIAARGTAELVAASPPEGTGLEPEAASAPAGTTTDPGTAATPAPERPPAGRRG